MEYSLELVVSLCLAAFCAGVVNSVAGGGTLLTFPALLTALAGLGPEAAVVANATSTLALVPGSIASAWGYRDCMSQTRRWFVLLVGPSLIGGIIGALLMTQFPDAFAGLVPWLLLLAAVVFLTDTLIPKKRRGVHVTRSAPALNASKQAAPSAETPSENEPEASRRAIVGLVLFQLLVAIYGGYFGAGAGILMLSSLAMMGVGDIHQMNGLKTTLGFVINGVSSIIFIVEGKIVWPLALSMALTATVGGYLGARLAQRIHPRLVRWGVIFVAFGLAGYYFFH
jgi:uncharacterized membrane protein YfcA